MKQFKVCKLLDEENTFLNRRDSHTDGLGLVNLIWLERTHLIRSLYINSMRSFPGNKEYDKDEEEDVIY
jgi:hypothetical protein